MSFLVGKAFTEDKQIHNSIQQLLDCATAHLKKIDGVRSPLKDLVDEYEVQIKQIADARGRALFYPYIGSGAGQGPYVELGDGSVKLDLIAGIGVYVLGHSHPQILKTSLEASLSDIVVQGNLQPNAEYGRLMKKLTEIAGKSSRLKHVWLAPSGSMANENALKICRQKNSPAHLVLAMNSAFAGRTTMMAEITDNENYKVGLPRYDEVLRAPFYDKKDPQSGEKTLAIVKEHVANNEGKIATMMLEPVQGEGGYKVPTREFLVPILDFCKEKGIAIWFDEIQTFCRTGEFFAFETLGLGEYVDICTIAKSLQGAATLYTEEYNPKPGLVAGTFAGSTVALRAGLEVLNILGEGHWGPEGRVAKIHSEFVSMLSDLSNTTCKGYLEDPEGLGLMVAVTPFGGNKEKVLELLKVLFKNGLIVFGCGSDPFRIRFLLPAVLTSEHIQVAKGILEKSILELAKKNS